MNKRLPTLRTTIQAADLPGHFSLSLINKESDISCSNTTMIRQLEFSSNQKIVSRELREKDNLLQSFLHKNPQLSWIIDENANLHFASEAFFEYFGTDQKKAQHERITSWIPISVFKTMYPYHQEVFKTGRPVNKTERIRLADGNDLVCHINLFPLESSSDKKIIGGQAIHLPDTSILERELQQVQERLVTLNKATSDAIWEWDMQSGQMMQNDVLLRMTGFQPDPTRGLSWWLRHIHPEDRNRIADKIKDTIENHQQSWQDEYQFRCADGNYRHIRHRGYVVYENGLPVKMIGSLNDVSSLKSLENRLAEEKIKKQKDISQAVIDAQESERTQIGRELHDNVNQLLSATKLFISVLTPQSKQEQQVKDKSIDYIQLAIDEIRKVSKELVAPRLKEQGLIESIQMIIDDLQLVSPLQMRFVHDLDTDLVSSGKKITIFRIVQEQVKNILKHSKASNTTIHLQSNNEHLQLLIEDNGDGFDPHQTAQGIGLNNIRERVKFYNGTVSIETSPGKGCTLSVIIPLCD